MNKFSFEIQELLLYYQVTYFIYITFYIPLDSEQVIIIVDNSAMANFLATLLCWYGKPTPCMCDNYIQIR